MPTSMNNALHKSRLRKSTIEYSYRVAQKGIWFGQFLYNKRPSTLIMSQEERPICGVRLETFEIDINSYI